MKIQDKIYGSVEIDEPLLTRLIKSDPVQRLKKIYQGGATQFLDPKGNVTRYEHSVGVMILLRMHGASVEEQAAGLIHDTGHAAFSHVVDSIFKGYNHNYDDAHIESMIEQSDIPGITEKHGIDWRALIQKEKYPLLEQPLPKLCADRIDYTLRDSAYFTAESTRMTILENLTTYKGEFAFKTHESARAFSTLFNETNARLWNNPQKGLAYEILAEALKEGIKIGSLTEADLRGTDAEVWEKLRKTESPLIQRNLARLTPELDAEVNPTHPDYVHRFKVRHIDPLVADGIRVQYLSQLDSTLMTALHEAKAHPFKEVPLRILES